MKQFTSDSQKIGEIGEGIACKFLMKRGFDVIERNYTKKCGEIDIVAKNGKELHFVEVKSVSCDTFSDVSGETGDDYRPEDNMHPWKVKRLSRTIQMYLLEREVPEDTIWKFDVACVYLDVRGKKARVKMLEDIIL